MTHRLLALCFALVALADCAARAQGKLWQVANDPDLGLPFKQIQPAVDAAQDGDIVAVWDGSYQPVVIDGKSLTVLNWSFMNAGFTCPDFVVRNLRADQVVSVRGMNDGQIRLHDNEGRVLLEQIDFGRLPSVGGCSYGSPSTTSDALSVRACAEVIVTDCELVGAARQNGAGRGIYVEDSNLYVYASFVAGGTPLGSQPARGGTALECVDSNVFMSGWALQGGCGSATQPGCAPGGPGGVALRVTSGPPPVLQNVALFGGAGGCSPNFPDCGSCGSDGNAQEGDATHAPGSTRMLSTFQIANEGGSAKLFYGGLPDEFVIYVASPSLSPAYAPAFAGAPALLLTDAVTVVGGWTTSSGALTTNLQLPQFPPELYSIPFHWQAVGIGTTGELALSNPSSMLVFMD